MKYARFNATGRVLEIVDLPASVDVADCFPPALGFCPCPDDVGPNWTHTGGQWSPPPAAALQHLRDAATGIVDAAAEVARGTYLTAGTGQAMTYLHKEARAREAQALVAAGATPATGDFPMLDAEVGVTGADLKSVVETILTQADAWETVATAIEAARLSGKATIAAATTAEAVTTARDTALAALDALRASPRSPL